MCGRFAFYSAAEAVTDLFGVSDAALSVIPQYNIAPTDLAAVIRPGDDGARELAMLRWGLLPFWAKDRKMAARMINARSETVTQKPAFRAAFRERRCIVPADGFYEWTGRAGHKQPWFISRSDDTPIGFAGLWERWRDRDSDEPVETFTILTMASAGGISSIHDRMPVMLDDVTAEYWLAGDDGNPPALRELSAERLADELTSWPVSTSVNNARNESPALIEPVDIEPDEEA